MLVTIARLPPPRQRNVGNALDELLKAGPTYTPQVTDSAKAVIAATPALSSDDTPMFTIDVATDGVLTAIHRIVKAYQRGLVDTIVPLGSVQQAQRDAAILIDSTWFPAGIGFIRDSVGIQHAAMNTMRKALVDPQKGPALKAAVTTLGLDPLVNHFIAHANVYARKLGLAGEVVTDPADAPSDPSEVWHDLYEQFAVDASAAYRKDPATLKTLLGPYESQLEEHYNDLAKERRRAKAAAAKAEADAKAKAEADAKAKAEADAAAKKT